MAPEHLNHEPSTFRCTVPAMALSTIPALHNPLAIAASEKLTCRGPVKADAGGVPIVIKLKVVLFAEQDAELSVSVKPTPAPKLDPAR
jgi:hypothetical protein